MSPTTLLLIGTFAVALIGFFVYYSVHAIRKNSAGGRPGTAALTGPTLGPPPRSAGPMRILVATDGSAGSDCAIASVAGRPWPPNSQIAILTVVHTNVPMVPDVFLGGAAAHVTALEEDRDRAPVRLQQARERLSAVRDVSLTSLMLEGDPAKAVVEEADRWKADLIVVGSHGYGVMKKLLLGSVAQAVAQHAHCSVEIVRCPQPAAASET